MQFHRCTINKADGTIVCEDVEISIEIVTDGDQNRWHGTVSVTHLAELKAGNTYVIALDDGRQGDFTVRRNTFAGGENRAVSIFGNGPLAAST